MSKRSESGNVLEIGIIVVLLLAIVGLVVWRVLDSGSSKTASPTPIDSTQNNNANPPTMTGKEEPTKTGVIVDGGYYAIARWGVKIKLGDIAGKVSFEVSDQSGNYAAGLFTYDGTAVPSFLPAYLQDKTCAPGLSLFRAKDAQSMNNYTAKKVGDYYYIITGGPGACSNDPQNNPDDQLKAAFLKAFTIENLESL